MNARPFDVLILAIGVAAVSTAAVLIREADAPTSVIAASRVALASLPLLGLVALRGQNPLRAGRTAVTLTLLSGAFLALHFGFWVASVQQTSIITSVVLVTTTPLLVGLVSGPLLGERPGRVIWLGLAIAAAGTLVMVAEDFDAGSETLEGDAFALLGAAFAGGYLMAGRKVLDAGRSGWLPYSTLAYSTAAVLLIGAALLAGDALEGYSRRTYVFILLLALVPQLVGHTAINRSLGHIPAILVSLVILSEPVGATLLAAVFLDEHPTALQLAGGLVVLTGVGLGLRGDVRTTPVVAAC
jgi:drug/metabolite transporter (DMT)-like permease